MATVVLDLTPLNTDTRMRGIGRYVAGLAGGIAALDPAAREGLEVTGLVRDLPWDGGPWFDPTLRCAGRPRPEPGPIGHRVRQVVRRATRYARLRREGGSLFHATLPFGFAPPADLPYVVTCYDLIPLALQNLYPSGVPFSPRWRRRLAGLWYRRARRVIAISEATRHDLVVRLGVDPARIDVVPCGLDHARFHAGEDPGDEARARAAVGTTRPFLLYVGGVDPRKNVSFLIDAYAQSGAAAEADLVLAGHLPEADRAALRATARTCGVDGRVLLTGFVPDDTLASMYRRCRGHVFASTYEGFGLTVAEALACGAPTATAMNTSIVEVAGDAAIELPSADADGAAAVIRRLVSDPALRDDLRRRGPLQVRKFTWDACARGVLETYRRALADCR